MNIMKNNIYLSANGEETVSLRDADFLIINDIEAFMSDCEEQAIIPDGVKTTGFYQWNEDQSIWNPNLSTDEIEFVKKYSIKSANVSEEKVNFKESNMKIKEIKEIKYQTEDGKIFATYEEAEKYVKNTDALLKARKTISEYCKNMLEKDNSCEFCPFAKKDGECYECGLFDCESPSEWLF